MNKFKDISELERLMKNNLQGHSTPAPSEVWSNVAASTAQSASVFSQATRFLSSTTNLLKVALFVGGIAAVGIVIYNENKASSEEPNRENIIASQTNSTPEKILNILDSFSPTEKPELPIVKPRIQQENRNNTTTANKSTGKTHKTDDPKVSNASITDASQPADKPKEVSPTIKIAVTIRTHFDISNTKPCTGESVTLSQTNPTNWYVNEVQVAQNTATYILKTAEPGILFVSNGNQTKSVDVHSLSASITTQKTEAGKFRCQLEDGLSGNWHLDDKLVHTNASTVDLEIPTVGTHEVKSTIINHACNSTVSKTITIEPIGSITFYEIFTPDGDRINDFYTVDISDYENFSIQILDNNNRRVFLSQSPEHKWNGKVNNQGEACTNGAYYAKISYKLKGENPQVKTVILALKR